MNERRMAMLCLAAVIVIIVFHCLPVCFLTIKPKTLPYIVAVPADQASLGATVAPVFSRCRYFVICDIRNNTVKYVPNKYANGTHEVGLHVTHLLLDQKVGVVIAANIGPEPYEHLGARGVKIYCGMGKTILDAVRGLQVDALQRLI